MASTPPTNEQFLREVDDELRRETAAQLWRRWGRWAVVALIVALVAFGGFLFWQWQSTQTAGTEGEKLAQALDDIGADKAGAAQSVLGDLSASSSAGQRALAKLALAALAQQQNDIKSAVTQYGAIAADTTLAKPFRDLALIRQTAAEYDTLAPEQIVARLKPLAVTGHAFFGSAGEMTGIAYLRLNKTAEAGAVFASMAKDEKIPASIRERAVELAATAGVDAVPATKPAAINSAEGKTP